MESFYGGTKFYTLSYALISSILGQNLCFAIWSRALKNTHFKNRFRKNRIFHDQNTLSWPFLLWFCQLGFLFGLFFGLTFSMATTEISFYNEFRYLFPLIVVVLFLQSWNSIRLYFKKNSLKWMIASGLIVSFFSFVLSRVPVIDFNSIETRVLKENITFQCPFDLPESKYSEKIFSKLLCQNIHVSLNGETNEAILIIENRHVKMEELPSFIRSWRAILPQYEKQQLVLILYVHAEVKTKTILELKKKLADNGINKIGFAVIPVQNGFTTNGIAQHYFPWRLPPSANSGIPTPPEPDSLSSLKIYQLDSLNLKYKDQIIPIKAYSTWLQKVLHSDSVKPILFIPNPEVAFKHYLNFYSETYSSYIQLREKYSRQHFKKELDLLDEKNQQIMREKYPIRIREIPTLRVGEEE